jgi:hypothetical protein
MQIVQHVLVVDKSAILTGVATKGIAKAVAFAQRNNLTGYMLDYMHIPKKIEAVAATMYGTSIFFQDKTEAKKFAEFMMKFTSALHKKVSYIL